MLDMPSWVEVYWKYGDEDLQAAELIGSSNCRLATYLAYQAVEKWLKALLANKIDLGNRHAFEHLAREHDANELLERVCAIYAPLLGTQLEFLRLQAISLVQWPLNARQINGLRYPRLDWRTGAPSDWALSQGAWSLLHPQVTSFRRWAAELRRF